ncbi:hypothetical protein ACOZ38_24050 [Sphaerisporangium viridialbum]|uniref:hypothetical protein n=1 Tax=Sphaerisporangium viridialbum TaxID=46189 RepID=UPI003C708AF9
MWVSSQIALPVARVLAAPMPAGPVRAIAGLSELSVPNRGKAAEHVSGLPVGAAGG